MPWQQLVMEIGPGESEALEAALREAGAVAVTLEDGADQPLFEPPPGATPLWDRLRLTALLPLEADPLRVLLDLAAQYHPRPLPPHRLEWLDDQAWERAWLKDFKPMRFGQRLWVVPSAHQPPDPSAVNLRLDPGLAFGTGTHPTTALCLAWLDGAELAGLRVIDYGCGSGILGVAAGLLGAANIEAVDIDPQALTATRENARCNGLLGRVHVSAPETLGEAADVLLANILAGPLQELAPRFRDLLKPGGWLVMAGLLARHVAPLQAAYGDWITLSAVDEREGWVCLAGQRPRN
ncbi:MAG TPA: 50S ribosomal protein L11 methyltransferase [Candidatus Macondimonas sp.]|nr:50S ribosomal protein L11 methyltransferase [Candidatus Macondimonas sp.]